MNHPARSKRVHVERIDHVAIVVTDVDRARAFYAGVLGLTEIPRPPSFDFPGAWFQVGPEVIHLLGQDAPDARGRRHFCLWVSDVHAAAEDLADKGVPVRWNTSHKIEGVDRFFTEDPDGNRIEIQAPDRAASA